MPTTKEKDACDLLDADHRAVKKLFKEYEELSASRARAAVARKRELALQICTELTVHAQIEEEIFYPALRDAIKETDLLAEAEVEHQSAKDLIAQIEAMDADESHFNAKVKVLGEMIDHHVTEEREKMFPQARSSGLDLAGMVPALQERKAQLMQEMGEGVAA